MPRVGDLDKWMVFQAPYGSPVAWQTSFTCKGQKRGLSGQERITALAVGSTLTGTVFIRWRPIKIRTTWRILCEGATLNIGSSVDTKLPEGRFWVIKITEVG